ncbi:uncharacterized protein BCR38DRAFT_496752, partial [Pseudomassariella vexata]
QIQEDSFAFLTRFDTVLVIDDSSSITSKELTGISVLEVIVLICPEHDDNGLDIYFMNYESPDEDADGNPGIPPEGRPSRGYYNIPTASEVLRIFNKASPPCGDTQTGKCLHQILKPYLDYYETKAKESDDEAKMVKLLNIIVWTDGGANDGRNGHYYLGKVIRSAATRLDDMSAPFRQIGIQFFQVGNVRQPAGGLIGWTMS